MLTIARFNWPFYVVAIAVLLAALCGAILIATSETKIVLGILSLGALYFLVVSLGVSHLVYDRSDLYRWHWLDRALRGATRNQMIFCHSGFDESSRELHAKLGEVGWLVLDHFNAKRMTEASIQRARRLFPPTLDTLQVPFDAWPVNAESVDVVFGLLAIHELRSEGERVAWFSEARRCLRREGRIVLVEHIRDLANFIAFGPGFLHFHSRASWRRSWELAGLRCRDEFRVTPWVRVFVIATP